MKKTWKLLGNLMGSNTSRNRIIKLIDGNGDNIDENEVCNKFAEYFGEIGNNLETNLVNSNQSPTRYIQRNLNSFMLFPVTMD